jgi:hypothetical protein
LVDAHIFVDDIRQCRTDGGINVPLSEGLITEADIAGEIGEVVTGKKHGRTARNRHAPTQVSLSASLSHQRARLIALKTTGSWEPEFYLNLTGSDALPHFTTYGGSNGAGNQTHSPSRRKR